MTHQRFPARGSWPEARRIAEVLRKETVGGILLVIAAAIALVLANSPLADGYFAVRDFRVGPAEWNLDLTIGQWASDGLLAIFFFLVGLELKREFVAGDLRHPRTAVVPVVAAAGGVLVPAVIFVAVTWGDALAFRGWAVPTATDIAFAVAVLAIIGSHLPSALRIFLLTLAVVDDLIAITIIAVFYTETVMPLYLALALIPIAAHLLLARRFASTLARHRLAAWGMLVPLGVIAWLLVHASGVHPTVAGVLLAFTIPVMRAGGAAGPGLAEVFEHRLRPLSSGFVLPVFAFFAAGVAIGGADGFFTALAHPVTIGIVTALVLGKPIGIVGSTWLVTRFTRAELERSYGWIDLVGIATLAGIGFTVSLLIGELAFGHGPYGDLAKVGVLTASVIAAVLAALLLIARNGRYRRIERAESADDDRNGIPDVYETGETAS